ncbi:MAG: hypothetical protein H0T76_03755 [Nannocystis sp.]|nr:hypothetical protein [Nannocystis sp.]MBA3545577.1 hypothetical protein [Nannocystis sp.]
MSKLSPLQTVKKLHGTKDQLISKVLEMFTPAEGESKEEYAKRLKYVANAKLLRLSEVGTTIAKLGGAATLITKIAEFKGQAKDKDFVAKLGTMPLPRLLETYQTLDRKAARAAKGPRTPKADRPVVKAVKAAVAAVKAAVSGKPAKKAGKPAKKR